MGGMLLARIFLLVKEFHSAKSSTISTWIEVITIILTMVLCVTFRNYSREGYMYALLIIFMIFIMADGKGKISKAMKNKTLLYLSQFSFAFYLIHYTILMIVNVFIEKFDICSNWQLAVCAITAFLVTLCISMPIYFFIEKT